jgi:hypothetical protein
LLDGFFSPSSRLFLQASKSVYAACLRQAHPQRERLWQAAEPPPSLQLPLLQLS